MNITREGFLVFSSIKNVLEYRTLMYILSNTDEHGNCNARQNDIAIALNTHRQAVNRSIRSLEEKKIFAIEKIGSKRIYHINPEYCITIEGYNNLKQNFDNYKKITEATANGK